MARPTTESMLENVENAIVALTTGQAQSYTIRGRTFTRSTLDQLRTMRRELIDDLEIEQGADAGHGDGLFVTEW